MSGGHWNYLDTKLEEQGINLKETFYFLAAVEHELDWGITNDTCLDCAKLRAAEALILYFDGSVASAIAIVRDRQQNQCAKERR